MTKPATAPLKVACVTCYFSPDYVRSVSLRAGVAAADGVEPIIIKNRHTNGLRYLEVVWAMLKCRWQQKPDVWLLNFRGYELLPLTLLLAGRRPVIYDEFVNPVLVVEEHRRLKQGLVRWLMGGWQRLGWIYYWLVRHCAVVLTDTAAQADYAAKAAGLPRERVKAIPVAADETLFMLKPDAANAGDTFDVFFYGTGTQPLHGVDVILDAARRVANVKNIRFTLAGTKGNLAAKVAAAQKDGANIRHFAWIPFDELPIHMRQAGLCLGGPFGGTPQAELVVTGKTTQMLACGAPVVVGQSQATAGAFRDRGNSLMVPQQDPAALAEAINWAATHPAELKVFAAQGRALYEQHFSQQVVNRDVAALLRQVSAR